VKEGNDGKRTYFWLMRHSIYQNPERGTDIHTTDIHTVEEKNISITNLHTLLSRRKYRRITDEDCAEIFAELKSREAEKVK